VRKKAARETFSPDLLRQALPESAEAAHDEKAGGFASPGLNLI
jgi:hypothetical protein